MKKSVTVVSMVRINQLLCCSAAVLLAACGGGGADTTSVQPDQTAAVSYDGASRYADIATADDSTAATTSLSSTQAVSASGPDESTRLLADSTAVAAAATAIHLYVAPNGSDSNPGTQAAPFRTIARADARASAGYTIHVAPGIYKVTASNKNSAGILTTKSGTPSARIKFVSDVQGAAKIDVSGIGSAWHSKGSYVDIVGFDISGQGRHGILAGGRNLTITNNFIHELDVSGGCNGSGGAGIDTYGPVGNVVINANVVRNIGNKIGPCNTVHGIYVANPNNIVTNNIVSGAAAVGINQWHAATAGTIVNNTTFNNGIGILLGQGDGGMTPTGSENNYVANNIVYKNRKYGIVEGGRMGGNNRYINNLVNSSGTNLRVKGATGTISADPLFVNYQADGSGNYRLHSSSPAIDRGTATLAPKTDIAGVARPRGSAFDIGAYEF